MFSQFQDALKKYQMASLSRKIVHYSTILWKIKETLCHINIITENRHSLCSVSFRNHRISKLN